MSLIDVVPPGGPELFSDVEDGSADYYPALDLDQDDYLAIQERRRLVTPALSEERLGRVNEARLELGASGVQMGTRFIGTHEWLQAQ